MKYIKLKDLLTETDQTSMYKILRHKIKGMDSIPTPPSQAMTFGQAENWVSVQPPGLSLYYIIVPEKELNSDLYRKMKLY